MRKQKMPIEVEGREEVDPGHGRREGMSREDALQPFNATASKKKPMDLDHPTMGFVRGAPASPRF